MKRGWKSVCGAATTVTFVLTAWGAAAAAPPQHVAAGDARLRAPVQDDLPCGVTYTREVTPLTVQVNGTVHVHIEAQGDCEAESVGINAFFVVDRSITMFDKGYMAPTKQALISFVNAMDFTTSMAGLITYAGSKQVNRPLTADRDAILQSINTIRLSEEDDVRSLPAAFRDATQLLDSDGVPGSERVIFIIAAGPDRNSALVNMPTVTQAARNIGVKVVFLMFPDSEYLHFVEAASDCTGSFCGLWAHRSGQLSKWAWGVTAANISQRFNDFVGLMLRGLSIEGITIEEYAHSGAVVMGSSVQPPPHDTDPDFRRMLWEFESMPPGGITIDYDTQMIYEDEIYPVSDVSEFLIRYSGMAALRRDMPNPDVDVRGQLPTATNTPEGPTDTPEPPTATPTEQPENEYRILLPITMNKGEL